MLNMCYSLTGISETNKWPLPVTLWRILLSRKGHTLWFIGKGERRPYISSLLFYMCCSHTGDFKSRKRPSAQTFVTSRSMYFVKLSAVVLLSSFLTPGKALRGKKCCKLSNTFQYQMPGHNHTLLTFLHLKVQQFLSLMWAFWDVDKLLCFGDFDNWIYM